MANEKHVAAINELKAELGPEASAPAGVMLYSSAAKSQATTTALTVNHGVGVVKFQEPKNWSGSVVGAYPPSFPPNRSGKTTHRGVPPKDAKGSMGAVVYVGPNVQGGDDCCAWVVAWSVPGDGSLNKVYVEAGPSTKYPKGEVDWDSIKTGLEGATNECYKHDIDDTGAEVTADIDAAGNAPRLAVVLDVTQQ